MLFLTLQKDLHNPEDKAVLNNLDLLIERAGDALRSLETISYYSKYTNHPTDNEKVHSAYIDADRTHPASNRTSDKLPKDAFHNACDYVHKAYANHLKDPLKGELEKAFYKQRADAILTAKAAYMEMQREKMGLPAISKPKKKDKGMEM
jgi:hypothetical protein